MHPLAFELDIACALARRAADVAMQFYHAGVAIEYKGQHHDDPVTQADKEANRIIVQGLKKHFPDDGIMAEETPSSHIAEQRQHKTRLWCIDPIDGTREFIAHNGEFVVMIGLAIDGVARLGVVVQPTRNLVYAGCWAPKDATQARCVDDKDCIAWVDDGVFKKKLKVSAAAPAHGLRLVVSKRSSSASMGQFVKDMHIVERQVVGSVGLKMVRIAAAQAEIYVSLARGMHEWDACGPDALVVAAGGTVTDALGQTLRYNKSDTRMRNGILATFGAIHPACCDVIASLKDRPRGA